MNVLDPLRATRRIGDSYRRYLLSTFGPRRRDLFDDFKAALRQGIDLDRGPFVEATPPFAPGRSIADLMDEGVLSRGFEALGSTIPLGRPLHRHQDEAIRKSIGDHRNLVVSTGTGSGKTETFLLPILDHLFREREAGTLDQPGVRALLLYPMNALANDQVKRLRELLRDAPDITFGRYTGETRATLKDAKEDFAQRYPGAEILENELISREQMQKEPPRLLLTNYAMLEYLLLRPTDTPFFDGPTAAHWKFIVLDEAHVYGGAQGTEVALLLRRLRDRTMRSEQGRLRCFATSATLGTGSDEDNQALVKFASDLFDEPFEWAGPAARRDVVLATRLPLAATAAPSWTLTSDQIANLRTTFRSGGSVEELAAAAGEHLAPSSGEPIPHFLARLLSVDGNLDALQHLLADTSAELRDLARSLFRDLAEAEQRIVDLVDLSVNARFDELDAPLLPARYHYFVRSLEGGFLCLHPRHPSPTSRISLNRSSHCTACIGTGVEAHLAEIGVCRYCHAEYLVGRFEDPNGDRSRLIPAAEFERSRRYFLLGEADGQVDENDALLDDQADELDPTLVWCPGCGFVSRRDQACECTTLVERIPITAVAPGSEDGIVHRCASCGERSAGEVVFRFLTGTDAPVAVVATDLYQELPPSTDVLAADQPGEGRKLLAFSDSRQQAAFFAAYMERTYGRALQRALVLQVLEASREPLRTEDLCHDVLRLAERQLVLDPDDGRLANLREVNNWITEELLALDRRQSLEGVGLARIELAWPRRAEAPRPLLALGFDEREVRDLLQILLMTLRNGAAITALDGVDFRDDRFAPRNFDFSVRGTGSSSRVIAFSPGPSALNRRADFLGRVLAKKGRDDDPRALLEGLWRHLSDASGPWSKTLVSASNKSSGITWKLDTTRFELSAAGEDIAYQCDRCGRLSWWSVEGVCPGWRCSGQLTPASSLDAELDHYVSLYRSLDPIALSAQEHTAQWTAREASAVQDRFIRGDFNLLSCSTTFEMGVDIGDVQAVLLRNMPPSAANYVQRAGRAGRRTGAAALVVTFAQRRNHDRSYFDDPSRMVDGVIDPPRIMLDNVPIGRRHAHSVAFAAFLRHLATTRGEWPQTVGEFFDAPIGSTSLADAFAEWLLAHPKDVAEALERLLPPVVAAALQVGAWNWVTALLQESDDDPSRGWFLRAQEEFRVELEGLRELKAEALAGEDGGAIVRFQRVEATLRGRQLLAYLATRNVLPKYGFPVDVVELNLRGSGDKLASKLELDRDLALAITEFAPGSQVMAGKATWNSVGVATRPDHALPEYEWAVCGECGAFRRGLVARPVNCEVCGSPNLAVGQAGRFVVPLFGFIGRRAPKANADTRPLRRGFARSYFASEADGDPFAPVLDLDGSASISTRVSRQGRVTVINRGTGSGFGVCEWCGAGVSGRPAKKTRGASAGRKPHDDLRRPGRSCSGPIHYTDLGHEYLTDVAEVRIDAPMDRTDAMSVLYAILEGAASNGIARDEIDGTTAVHGLGLPPTLVIFDRVPGGAGHAQRVCANLPAILRSALRKVDGCRCADDTSCYSCLRSYGNQLFHDDLQRGRAASILQAVVG